MCQFDGTITLCTCSGEVDTTKAHWTLSRKRDDVEQYPMLVGEFAMPPYKVREALASLEAKLNRPGGCFDFDYTPQEDDTLTLKLDERRFVFVFDGGHGLWYEELWDTKAPSREIFNKGPVQITSEQV